MTPAGQRPYRGVFPVLPTTFDGAGNLDERSQLRAVDFFLEAGVDGFCILANFSEQFTLADAERDHLMELVLRHTAGRVPVIVTTSHYSPRITAERSRRAEAAGAAMVMVMPPYHGTLRPDEATIRAFFETVSAAIAIPMMVQDSPVSGITLSAGFLARLAIEIERVKYFKIESPAAAVKIREMLRLAGSSVDAIFDGEEGITLLADLDAGATGTMPGGMVPELFGRVLRLYLGGDRAGAMALYDRMLPLINYENKLCGLRATKALLKEGGFIATDATRPPTPPALAGEIRAGLLELARRLDPLVLASERAHAS